jgi:hypothetical protein
MFSRGLSETTNKASELCDAFDKPSECAVSAIQGTDFLKCAGIFLHSSLCIPPQGILFIQ